MGEINHRKKKYRECNEECEGYKVCASLCMLDNRCTMTRKEINDMIKYDKEVGLDGMLDRLFDNREEDEIEWMKQKYY